MRGPRAWRWLPTSAAGLVALGLLLCARGAAAEHLVVPAVVAEPDVADEGLAVSWLVHGALAREPGALIEATEPITVPTAAAAAQKLGADHVALLQLAREGTGLRATLVLAGRDGSVDISFVRAGDGDVTAIATGILEKLGGATNIPLGAVPPLALGRLRPYAAAWPLRAHDAVGAAARLGDAIPATALAVATIPAAFAGLLGPPLSPAEQTIAARAIGADDVLAQLGAGSGATATAARVFAAIDARHLDVAQQALGTKPLKDPLLIFALAVLAEHRGDDARMNQALLQVLAGDRAQLAMAFVSQLVPSRIAPEVLRAALALAARDPHVDAGVASRIAVTAAGRGIDLDRALSLISVRELDEVQLPPLDELAGELRTPDRTRLHAELAMRRADGTEATKIQTYLTAAPRDPRAHRYKGWLLLGQGQPKEAAAEFDAAGDPRERARALLEAGDPVGARLAIVGEPTTPEELAILARAQLLSPGTGDAATTAALAEQGAPVSPLVQRAVLDVAQGAHDASRAALAQRIIDSGAPATAADVAVVNSPNAPNASNAPSARSIALGSGARAGSGSAATAVSIALQTGSDLKLLLNGLPLAQLPSRHLVVAELAWQGHPWSVRIPHAEVLRPPLLAVLGAARIRVDIAPPLDDASTHDPAALAHACGEADGLLLYRVEPSGKATLVLYLRGASDIQEISGAVELDGAVTWDLTLLLPLAILGALVLLASAYRVWRGSGLITVVIDRPPDATDDVFHIEITTRSARPTVADLAKLRAATIRAGTRIRARRADHVVSGQEFSVPPGRWFVHMWGTYERGGAVRQVPDSATLEVTVERGKDVVARFDLVPKFAEVQIAIDGDHKRVTMWIGQETTRIYTDANGMATIPLPIGTHVLNFAIGGQTFTRTLQIAAPRLQRLAINLAREMRFSAAGDVALVNPNLPLELERTEMSLGTAARSSDLGGRYRITGELGRGAMGIVHRASDLKLERDVAIKEMGEELLAHPEAMALFTQEAKTLAQLNHSNIVAMYDQVDDGAKVLLIMEFVDGRTLAEVLRERGALPWTEAIGILDQVCAGLAYAHARKVIHRDIKPANIFIATDRVVKLGDFGLARVMRELVIRKTEVRGTPLYMAPEQIAGTNVDYRADLYALGAMMFEMLCGRPPFVDGEILWHQVHTPPPSPRAFAPDLPEPLEALVLALLAKAADDRPRSADEIRQALRRLAPY